MQTAPTDAERLVTRLVALAEQTGLPVTITADKATGIQVGVLNLVDLSDEDYFQLPVSIEALEERSQDGKGA